MTFDADPLVPAVSRCILDFSEQRGRGKGEAQENTATPYTALPSGTSARKGVLVHILSLALLSFHAPINAFSRFKTIALYTWRFSSDFLLTTPEETPQYPTSSLASSL